MHNLMLDIETLGTGPSAIVTSIGAVFFDPQSSQVGAEFYRELNFQDQIDLGRVPTQSTIEFWFGQPKEAQAAFLREGKVSTHQALRELRSFVKDNSDYDRCKPWGNGPSFDLTILESLFKDCQVMHPWHFRNVRCLRTFKEYNATKQALSAKREGVYHHALDDCKHQIKIITESLKKEVTNG